MVAVAAVVAVTGTAAVFVATLRTCAIHHDLFALQLGLILGRIQPVGKTQ